MEQGIFYIKYYKRFMKLGWAGSNFPDSVYHSIVGRPMLRFEEQLENVKIKVWCF